MAMCAMPQGNAHVSLLKTDLAKSVLGEAACGKAGDLNYTVYGYSPVSDARMKPAFSGESYDRHSACYLLGTGARLYSPILMRFVSPDTLSPFGRGGVNAYAYCNGDPVNYSDPTGASRIRQIPGFDVIENFLKNSRNRDFRLKWFEFDQETLKVQGRRAKFYGGKMLEAEETPSLSGRYYVNETRDLFVEASLRKKDGPGIMPLDYMDGEGLDIDWASKGFIKVDVNPTHVVLENGVPAYGADTILINDKSFKDYTKNLQLPDLAEAIRRGRPPRAQ